MQGRELVIFKMIEAPAICANDRHSYLD